MKIFTSQPMRDKTHEEILSSIRAVREHLEKFFKSTNIEIIESYHPENKNKKALEALGDSIKKLEEADFAVFLDDWNQYRGCKVEHSVTEYYNVPHIEIKTVNGLLEIVGK